METTFIENIYKRAYDLAKQTQTRCDLMHIIYTYFEDDFVKKILGDDVIDNVQKELFQSFAYGNGLEPRVGQFKKIFNQFMEQEPYFLLKKVPEKDIQEIENIKIFVAMTSTILTCMDDNLQEILENNNLTPTQMASLLNTYLYQYTKDKKTEISCHKDEYCVENLTHKKIVSKLIISRDSETNIIRQYLMRKEKNSILLLGDIGIGKKTILDKVALSFLNTDKEKIFIRYDISTLMAFDKNKIEFLMSLDAIQQSIQMNKNIIPIFDISTYVQDFDFIGILIPFFKDKRPVIISTTEELSRQMLENNSYIKRFNIIHVSELSQDDVMEILKNKKKEYESFYHVQISEDNLRNIIILSEKYINNKKFPEKAIDVLDSVCAYCKFLNKKCIVNDDIKHVISQLLGVSEEQIYYDNSNILRNLEIKFKEKIKGQDEAITQIIDSIYVSQTGLRDSNKTASSLFFIGKTAVGKTECCKVLSSELNIPLIRFDMSEYMETHSISKLLGSPPGYKDSGDGKAGNGLLINAISENPKCILLLDEIEKAHPKIHNLLLQIMDNGCITSAIGKKVFFDNVFLIMTSNVGATDNNNGFGFLKSEKRENKEFINQFLPEFRSRIDKIIYFNDLGKDVMVEICKKFLKELNDILKQRNIELYYEDDIIWKIIDEMSDGGAREIRNYITNNIKNIIAKDIIFGKYTENVNLEIKNINNTFVIERKALTCC